MAIVEVVRTYLEMRDPDHLRRVPLTAPGAVIEEVRSCPASFHRYLYREVGRHYHWRDRLGWTDEQIRAYLEGGRISLFVLYVGGAPAGYFELKNDEGSVEVAYFGLIPEFIGRGLGKMLLSAAVERAWLRQPTRVWLHTCTLDDPAALPNYLSRGLSPYKEERYTVEVQDPAPIASAHGG